MYFKPNLASISNPSAPTLSPHLTLPSFFHLAAGKPVTPLASSPIAAEVEMPLAVSSSSLLFFPSSLNLSTPSLSPKTLALLRAPSPFISLAASSTKSSAFKLFDLFGGRPRGPRTSFAVNVSVSSDLELEQGLYGDESSEGEGSFSPDLKLFVGNLPFSVDSAELAGLFGQAGNVEVVEVIYDKLSGKSRGFGFVTMSTVEEVEAAAQQFNGYELEGRPLRVNSGPPPPRGEGQSRGPRGGGGTSSGNRVYVGNLSWGVDDLALQTLFSEQGKVIEARVVYDRESGRSRGFGFVTYSSEEEVNAAISSLDGVDLDGRQIRVSVAEARPPRRQF